MGLLQKIFGSSQDLSSKFDKILIGLVPQELGRTIGSHDTRFYEDNENPTGYLREQSHRFIRDALPKYDGRIIEDIVVQDKSAGYECADSPSGLVIAYNYDIPILIVDKDDPRGPEIGFDPEKNKNDIIVPSFRIAFKPGDYKAAKRIMEAAMRGFYIHQTDICDEAIFAYGLKDDDIKEQGIKLLSNFFPKGTKMKTRCSYALSLGYGEFKIP